MEAAKQRTNLRQAAERLVEALKVAEEGGSNAELSDAKAAIIVTYMGTLASAFIDAKANETRDGVTAITLESEEEVEGVIQDVEGIVEELERLIPEADEDCDCPVCTARRDGASSETLAAMVVSLATSKDDDDSLAGVSDQVLANLRDLPEA